MATTRLQSKQAEEASSTLSEGVGRSAKAEGSRKGKESKTGKQYSALPPATLKSMPPSLAKHYKKIALRQRGSVYGKEKSTSEQEKNVRKAPEGVRKGKTPNTGRNGKILNSVHLSTAGKDTADKSSAPTIQAKPTKDNPAEQTDSPWIKVTKDKKRSPKRHSPPRKEDKKSRPKKEAIKSILKKPPTVSPSNTPKRSYPLETIKEKPTNPFKQFAATAPSKTTSPAPKDAPIPLTNAWGLNSPPLNRKVTSGPTPFQPNKPVNNKQDTSTSTNTSEDINNEEKNEPIQEEVHGNETSTSDENGNQNRSDHENCGTNTENETNGNDNQSTSENTNNKNEETHGNEENPMDSEATDQTATSTTTNGGVQQTLPMRLQGTDRYVEIAFSLQNVKEEVTQADQVEHMKKVLKHILHRGRNIAGDKKFGIQPIFSEAISKWNLGTIMKTDDIVSLNYEKLCAYLSHTEQKKLSNKKFYFKNGTNNRWRIKFTVIGVPWRKFCHLHQMSKYDESIDGMYIPFKPSPTQGEYCYKLGFLMNSSDKQLVEDIEKDLTSTYNTPITIKYDNMPGSYGKVNKLWKEAKKQAGPTQDMSIQAKWNPQALCIYTTETNPRNRSTIVEKLIADKSKQDKNEEYPLMAGGARMRFVPAYEYLAKVDQEKCDHLVAANIELKKNAVDYALPMNSDTLSLLLPTIGKTVGECILNLYDSTTQEMIFRHFTRGWSKNYEDRPVRVSCMKKMSEKAEKVLRNLTDILSDVYGKEMETLLAPCQQTEVVVPTLRIDINDRYYNGKAKCIIEGMEKLQQYEDKGASTKAKVMKKEAKEFGVTTYEDYSVSTLCASNAEPKLEAKGAITDLDSANRDDNSTWATQSDAQEEEKSEAESIPDTTNPPKVRADDASGITQLTTGEASTSTHEQNNQPNKENEGNRTNDDAGDKKPEQEEKTSDAASTPDTPDPPRGDNNAGGVPSSSPEQTTQPNKEAQEVIVVDGEEKEVIVIADDSSQEPSTPEKQANETNSHDPPSPSDNFPSPSEKIDVNEADQDFNHAIQRIIDQETTTTTYRRFAERRGDSHDTEYPWEPLARLEQEELENTTSDTEKDVPFPLPPRVNEIDEGDVYNDQTPKEFFQKWGHDIYNRILKFNKSTGISRYHRMKQNPVKGIDFNPEYFFHRNEFPVSITEVENILRFGLVGPGLEDEEEEIIFRLQTGLYNDEVLQKAKDKKLFTNTSAIRIPRRLRIPDNIELDASKYISYDIRSTVFRFFASEIFQATMQIFNQKIEAGESFPFGDDNSTNSDVLAGDDNPASQQ